MVMMKFPKNIMQIGMVDEELKVYIEDYVYTYIKQYEQEIEREVRRFTLFGEEKWDQKCHYLLIYGATSDNQNNKVIHEKYFQEYQMVGQLDIHNKTKTLLLKNQNKVIFSGFYIFYESNYQMQSYLVDLNKRSESVEKEYRHREKTPVIIEKSITCQKQKKQFYPVMSLGIVIVLLFVCVTLLLNNDKGVATDFLSSMKRAVSYEEENSNTEDILFVNKEVEHKIEDEKYIENIKVDQTVEETIDIEKNEISEIPVQETIALEEVQEVIVQDKEGGKRETNDQVRTYTIQNGDTLLAVSRREYQTDDRVEEICRMNEIVNPDKITPGQVIKLP